MDYAVGMLTASMGFLTTKRLPSDIEKRRSYRPPFFYIRLFFRSFDKGMV